MTGASVYELFGVRVRSTLPLGRDVATPGEPAGRRSGVDAPAPDVELELVEAAPVGDDLPPGEVLVDFVLDGVRVYSAADDGRVRRLRVHRLCEFEIDPDLRRARCRPDPAADPDTVALVSRGAFLAFWLGLHGACVLHASAVDVDGRAVAFVGGSGVGKSTLAGWACAAGAMFITDDLLRVDGSVHPHWVGRAPELRLRDGAADLVDGRRRHWALRTSVDGRLAGLPPMVAADAGPLCAVVLPNPTRAASHVRLVRLDAIQAVFALSLFPRVEGWCWPSAREGQLDGVSRIASAVPVYVATIPWGPPFDQGVIEELLATTVGSARQPQVQGVAT